MPARHRLVLAVIAVWVLAPALLAVARWPEWWAWIAPEQTPMTWLQSVALVLAGAGSLLIGHIIGRAAGGPAYVWWLLAAGFWALAVDERFAVHERVRDSVLAPRGVSVPLLPWVAPGDFLLLAVGLAGLAVLPRVWRAMSPDRAARTALVVGVVLAAAAVGMDSIDPSTWGVAAERLEQTIEEVVELGSGLALLAAVCLRLLRLLEDLVAAAPASGPDTAESGTTGQTGRRQRDSAGRRPGR